MVTRTFSCNIGTSLAQVKQKNEPESICSVISTHKNGHFCIFGLTFDRNLPRWGDMIRVRVISAGEKPSLFWLHNYPADCPRGWIVAAAQVDSAL
jgi:hypothetical protein